MEGHMGRRHGNSDNSWKRRQRSQEWKSERGEQENSFFGLGWGGYFSNPENIGITERKGEAFF